MGRGNLSRRDVLKGALALGGGGLIVMTAGGEVVAASSQLAAKNMPTPFTNMFRRPPVLMPAEEGVDDMGPYQKYRLTQKLGRASIVPGLTTTIAGYNGIFPGPTMRVRQGTRTEVRICNALSDVNKLNGRPFSTVTHMHGSASLPQYDGYANDQTKPGQVKTYKYPNWQQGRTLWYHDHNHGDTAQNVYSGLAAQYHLKDPYETAQLPQDEFDVPLIVSDVAFNADGSVAFVPEGNSGFMGDIIMVNGVPWPKMKVKPRVYRFRVLAATISRSFRFALSTGDPFYIVGNDAGMTPKVNAVQSWRQGGAERYEVLIDFRKYKPGTKVDLQNLSNKNNVDFANTGKVMQFEVVADSGPADTYKIPSTLDLGPQPFANRGAIEVNKLKPEMATARRRLRVERKQGEWTVNGETWADVEASNFTRILGNPKPYDVEIWDLVNESGGWYHSFHIHLIDAQIIGRNTTADGKAHPWEGGGKDVFYLGENETVTALMQFTTGDGNAGGRYMTHCHNLVHEDSDMMIQFAVGDLETNNPIMMDPPRPETEAEMPAVYAPSYPLGT
ncbi:Putative multicopper oxidase [Actinoplanes sp. SE50/110]|uniref:multicopper oxidase family protein n=1 Tax=Actinoplanes sp. (strain ATCC 31044 / CBS 674.73 / SE50/110) TaxID=134676 RepID=UPI00023EDF0F|nr:multicopper oxidase domain-containing protein [Actinoplanes sp. SE50/110]AEV88256.1 Putative multicopper oxidase [Actinoplanes sp. SE50/110]SLM04079.1 bilirubin oxidase [Actinoplanes sp. SE50/110]